MALHRLKHKHILLMLFLFVNFKTLLNKPLSLTHCKAK